MYSEYIYYNIAYIDSLFLYNELDWNQEEYRRRKKEKKREAQIRGCISLELGGEGPEGGYGSFTL